MCYTSLSVSVGVYDVVTGCAYLCLCFAVFVLLFVFVCLYVWVSHCGVWMDLCVVSAHESSLFGVQSSPGSKRKNITEKGAEGYFNFHSQDKLK